MYRRFSGRRTETKMPKFIRFTETIKKKQHKRIVSVTVRPIVSDCEGKVYFTGLMLQEGDRLSGYSHITKEMLKKYQTGDEYAVTGKRFFNGIVRGSASLIIFNLGKTSAGLDWKVYPNQNMAAETITLALGEGAHKVVFKSSARAGEELSLLASSRQCLKNGVSAAKDGFFQYCAACDSKHPVKLEDKKSARVYCEFYEMEDGDGA